MEALYTKLYSTYTKLKVFCGFLSSSVFQILFLLLFLNCAVFSCLLRVRFFIYFLVERKRQGVGEPEYGTRAEICELRGRYVDT